MPLLFSCSPFLARPLKSVPALPSPPRDGGACPDRRACPSGRTGVPSVRRAACGVRRAACGRRCNVRAGASACACACVGVRVCARGVTVRLCGMTAAYCAACLAASKHSARTFTLDRPWRAGACPQADRRPLRAREDSPAARNGKPMRGWVFVAALPRNGQVKETWTAQEARCGQQQHPPSGAKRTRCGGAGVRRVLGRLGPRVCGGGGGGSRRERRRGSSQSGVARPSFPTSKSDDLAGQQMGGCDSRELFVHCSVRDPHRVCLRVRCLSC